MLSEITMNTIALIENNTPLTFVDVEVSTGEYNSEYKHITFDEFETMLQDTQDEEWWDLFFYFNFRDENKDNKIVSLTPNQVNGPEPIEDYEL